MKYSIIGIVLAILSCTLHVAAQLPAATGSKCPRVEVFINPVDDSTLIAEARIRDADAEIVVRPAKAVDQG